MSECNKEIEALSGRIRRQLHEWSGQAGLLRSKQLTLMVDEERHRSQSGLYEKARVVLQELEGTWRGKYEAALAALGSQGLSSIWGDKREVVLESSVKRGIAHLDLALVKDGKRVRLKGGSGGSVNQVLAVILRVLTTLSNPTQRLFFALDEPFSQVAAAQRPAVCELVQGLREQLGFQLVVAAHEEELADAGDVVYQILGDGRGTARRMSEAEHGR